MWIACYCMSVLQTYSTNVMNNNDRPILTWDVRLDADHPTRVSPKCFFGGNGPPSMVLLLCVHRPIAACHLLTWLPMRVVKAEVTFQNPKWGLESNSGLILGQSRFYYANTAQAPCDQMRCSKRREQNKRIQMVRNSEQIVNKGDDNKQCIESEKNSNRHIGLGT